MKTLPETVRQLQTAIQHAPAPLPTGTDLQGWFTADGYYVCARCASRIMARGCALPRQSEPVWKDQPRGVCVTCEGFSPTMEG